MKWYFSHKQGSVSRVVKFKQNHNNILYKANRIRVIISDNCAWDLSLWCQRAHNAIKLLLCEKRLCVVSMQKWRCYCVMCPLMGQYTWVGVLPLLYKTYKVVLFLWYIFYDEDSYVPRTWRVFGHGSISRSFINCLIRYEPAFLVWMYCPILPYVPIFKWVAYT